MTDDRNQKAQQEARREEEAALWSRFAPRRSEPEEPLYDPEMLNALAAYAEGRAQDPGRERIERRLLASDALLDDLLFLREVSESGLPPVPERRVARAQALVKAATARPPSRPRFSHWLGGWNGHATALGRALTLVIGATALMAVSVAGFQLGAGARRQQSMVEQLLLTDLPMGLEEGMFSSPDGLGGWR